MSEGTVYIRKYNAKDEELFPVNMREVWRYSGYMGLSSDVDEGLQKVFEEVRADLTNSIKYQVCYVRVPITWENDMPVLPINTNSKDLAKCLWGSSEIVMFAATAGLEIDRHIAKYERFSPVKALVAHAYGAERVECLCDVFCNEIQSEIAKEELYCTPRFSPGYGDLPLEIQKDFFNILNCSKHIGVALNESLLMTPSKSVTAIFGIGSCVSSRREHKCENCNKTDCEYRKQ